MDFVACCLRNFNCLDYKPMEIKLNGNTQFHLIYKEKELMGVTSSYNYSLRFGVDVTSLLLENYVGFSIFENSLLDMKEREIIVNNYYALLQTFSNALWFIKDNSVTPYFSSISSDSMIEPVLLRRNVFYTNSETNYVNTTFSNLEIEEAMKWFGILDQFLMKMETKKVNSLTNMSNYITFDISSFQRAYYFLDIARKTDFLPAKITSYISILESLFSVKGDNTHKVAERTAALIGNNDNERIQIYRDIVSVYDIRSKYVHGSEIKHSTHELMPNTSKKLDSIVRKVLIEMFSNHADLNYKNKRDKKKASSKNAEDVDKWFTELVLRKE